MNNEWLNNLRSRMEDHEEDVPDGLWDEISDELFSEKEENNTIAGFAPEADAVEPKGDVGRNVGGRSLFYRIGGIAAAIALLFLMLKISLSNEETHKKLSQKKTDLKKEFKDGSVLKDEIDRKSADGIEKPEIDFSLADNADNTVIPVKTLKQEIRNHPFERKLDHKANANITGIIADEGKAVQEETPLAQKLPLVNEPVIEPVKEQKIDETFFKEEKATEKYAAHTKKEGMKSQKDKSWMLSMLTGNASSNAAEQQFPGYASISGKPMNIEKVWSASTYDDNALTAILLANQSQPVEARIRHKVPVTFGLSLYYNLGKKWGIGTGLNYTKLSSELHSGTDNNYIKGDQSVHYLGIPVQVNYNVIQKGRFTGYVTGGALVEKPISGSITTTYVVNDEIKETSKEKLDHKPFQFSVNTAVGLQLKIIDKLGVYAEPGIGYHFKEESAPNTIYKEKPLQFNVKFGLRLLLD
nr:outer membrane beta-barrel protein [uncultured Chryseobacterium sp.]